MWCQHCLLCCVYAQAIALLFFCVESFVAVVVVAVVACVCCGYRAFSFHGFVLVSVYVFSFVCEFVCICMCVWCDSFFMCIHFVCDMCLFSVCVFASPCVCEFMHVLCVCIPPPGMCLPPMANPTEPLSVLHLPRMHLPCRCASPSFFPWAAALHSAALALPSSSPLS